MSNEIEDWAKELENWVVHRGFSGFFSIYHRNCKHPPTGPYLATTWRTDWEDNNMCTWCKTPFPQAIEDVMLLMK